MAEEVAKVRRSRNPTAPQISIDTISRVENGENVTTDTLDDIAVALEFSSGPGEPILLVMGPGDDEIAMVDENKAILDKWHALTEADQETIKGLMERLAVERDAPREQPEEATLADLKVSPDEFREMTASPKKQATKTAKRKPG